MKKIALFFVAYLFLFSCKKEVRNTPTVTDYDNIDLTNIAYTPTNFSPTIPSNWPALPVPTDNALTQEKIELGRMLFYDPILSRDSSLSCAGCHKISNSFSDPLPKSIGLGGATLRHSMSLVNIAYQTRFFWDGRSTSLEEQSLHPVQDMIEMQLPWSEAEKRLRRSELYREKFRKAFGITKSGEITQPLASKALASFERTLLSYNSRIDKRIRDPFFELTDDEVYGFQLFSEDNINGQPNSNDFECWHCHGNPTVNLTMTPQNAFFNNGLDSVGNNLLLFADKGLGAITMNNGDNGKFKVPSLRNIAVSAPYMHDGRFATLDDMLNHYVSGGKPALNKDVNIHPIQDANPDKRRAIKAFLEALTDTTFLNNPAFKNPF